nr:histidine biosynthesis bifunctional protein HisB-like [Nerophis lumbriciformis]
MVSNQDGLGTESFPKPDFDAPHEMMLEILSSQGIGFSAIHIDPSFEHEKSAGRKPQLGMVLDYLKSGQLDLTTSCVIGDRQSDLGLAENMGIAGHRIGPDGVTWPALLQQLLGQQRTAVVRRTTQETDIEVNINLDRVGEVTIDTGIGFFDHMIEQLAKHGGYSLSLKCHGDLHIDEHHTVEDCALALGQGLREALGDKRGIGRYGFVLPMDEAQAQVAVDLGGRSYLVWEGELPREQVGQLHTEMVPHFFRSLADALGATIQIKVAGDNTHHMIEAAFKGVARALRPALARQGSDLPSTKGMLA